MQNKLKLAVIALCYAPAVFAQTDSLATQPTTISESAFTLTEAQLGEDEDMSQSVTIINSSSNIYANEVSYLFSPVRFRYRAFDQKFNDVYINGVPMNDMESGQFRFTTIGGLNQQTRNVEFALPFESNNFAMTGMGGSNNYNFRPGSMPVGQRISLLGANRAYTLRGMYTINTGLNDKGWAFAGNLTYRWANKGYVEGTFYNALSYFLGVQKVFGDGQHSLSLSTWGNPTERSSQGPATDEAYWLANDKYYNPYWGYQNGKKRNSRVINDFSPSAIMTWDWNINDKSKLTTSLFGRYSMYKSTKLNYNNADNPQPNYWKNLPSSYYDVWYNDMESYITDQAYNDWKDSYNYWRASKANRQINWDRLYASNQNINATGKDAMYYVEAKHNNNLTVSLASTYNHQIDAKKSFNLGFVAATNKGMHYVTMEDLLGANTFHNINTYAISDIYNANSDEVQYDLRNRNAVVKEGDRFRYDYNLLVNTGKVWGSYTEDFGNLHYTVAGRLGYTNMQRDGKMQNGLAANNSYGKSKHAEFVDGGLKFGSTLNMGHGNTLIFGIGYEHRAPQARNAFMAPEINNNFVRNLKNERVFSTELGYQYENAWMHLNLNAYYSRLDNVTDWQNFYHDDINSFEYVSLTDMKKEYYGVEAGVKFKVTSAFDVKLLGTISDAKIINNAKLAYMESVSGAMHGDDYGTEGDTNTNWDRVYNKGMRDSGTPLTAASLGVNYHQNGWFLSLNCNYYDRIYLSYSPNYRYRKSIENRKQIMSQRGIEIMDENNEPRESALSQAKGHGGFMLDGSIGRSIYLKHGSLSINLSLTNILNNRNIVTGGFEQSRSDYSGDKDNVKSRAYAFSKNPYKFYAFGTNGMLNLTYKF
jgi:hypothetical protein